MPLTHTCRLFRFCLWLTHSVSSVSHRLRLFSLSRILPFQFIWLFMPWASQLFWEMMQSRFPFKLVVEKKMDRLQKNIHLLLSSSLFTHSSLCSSSFSITLFFSCLSLFFASFPLSTHLLKTPMVDIGWKTTIAYRSLC